MVLRGRVLTFAVVALSVCDYWSAFTLIGR